MTRHTLRNSFALSVLLSVAGCPGTPPLLPPPDRDNDTIIDAQDACPDVPGVKSPITMKNGCPADLDMDGSGNAEDRDGDTITDAEDACPNEPGEKSADAKLHGCPAFIRHNPKLSFELPTKVTSLLQFVSTDVPVIVNVPRVDKVITAVDSKTREAILKEMLDRIGKELPFDANATKSLLESYNGAVVFVDPGIIEAGPQAAANSVCVAMKVRDFRAVDSALSSKGVERTGPQFTVKPDKAKEPLHGVWLADSGILLGCMNRVALSRSLAVANGKIPSFSSSRRFVADRANDVFVSMDLYALLGPSVEPGSELFASMTTQDQTVGLNLHLNLYGASYPPIGLILAPSSPTLIGKMPRGSLGAIGVSLKRANGKDLASLFTLVDKATNGLGLQGAKEAVARLGINFADIDAALGDDLAVGVYRNPKSKIDFEKSTGLTDTAIIVALATKDEATHKKLWNTLTTLAQKKPTEVSVKGSVIETKDNGTSTQKQFVRIDSGKGAIVFGAGDKATVKEALTKYRGTETIGWTTAFTKAREKEPPTMHAFGFWDGAASSSLVSKSGKPTTSTADGLAFYSMMFGSTNRGLDLTLTGRGAVDLIGIGAALAISSVKASVAETKTLEAQTNLRFIASHAQNAYEREMAAGKGARRKLCNASVAVPVTIPKATTYKPKMGAGGDWESGDENTGWKCLHFSTNEQIRYQYVYRQGGNYKGPQRGGPDPGKNGFEVSAEGDLDGNGKTSLFTRTGRIVGDKVVLDDEVFSSDPIE